MGLDIVAEGVETKAVRDKLLEMGCYKGQGWLFSEAVPAAEVPGLMAQPARSLPTPPARPEQLPHLPAGAAPSRPDNVSGPVVGFSAAVLDALPDANRRARQDGHDHRRQPGLADVRRRQRRYARDDRGRGQLRRRVRPGRGTWLGRRSRGAGRADSGAGRRHRGERPRVPLPVTEGGAVVHPADDADRRSQRRRCRLPRQHHPPCGVRAGARPPGVARFVDGAGQPADVHRSAHPGACSPPGRLRRPRRRPALRRPLRLQGDQRHLRS